ncbi:MAG TPA: Crp/Fnr family transcriptional regulator, partial [Burkholderiales bacterium]|nr:Crp/Fnr family transcriptional regulator [Burkholderiales bacterium]
GCTWSADILKSLPILSELAAGDFGRMAQAARRRSVPARSYVLRAGETPDGLYVVVSGRVRLVHQDQDGRALIAEIYGPGEFFGEMGLLDETASPASVVASEDCELVFIPRETVIECMNVSPAAAMSLLRTTLTRLYKAHRQMANLALTPVYGRVAQVLVTNGHEADGEWHVDVGSEQIAAMVGASREMVSRVLRCMIEKRVVRRFKRRLIVIDRAALSAPEA